MSYADAAVKIITLRAGSDYSSIPVNTLLLARAADAIGTVDLSPNATYFTLNGQRLASVGDLYAFAQLPGVRFQQLTAEANNPFTIDAKTAPPVLSTPFTAADLGSIIGDANIDLLRQMHQLWDQRVRATGFWTNDQVDRAIAIIDGGVIAYPEKPTALKIHAGGLDPSLLQPPFSGQVNADRYAAICQVFYDAMNLYSKGNTANAAAAVAAANANADFWDSALKVAEAIRDAPQNAAKYVAGSIVDTLLHNWIVVGAIIIIGGIFLFRGKVGAVVKEAAKAAGASV